MLDSLRLDFLRFGCLSALAFGVVLYSSLSVSAVNYDQSLVIIREEQMAYEEQLIHFARVLAKTEKELEAAVTLLSEKKTAMAMAEKQALRSGGDASNERTTKRLALAVKFAEGQVNLQQRRLLRLNRKRDDAEKGLMLAQDAEQAVEILQRRKVALQ